MPTSDEELARKKTEVAKLRTQVAAEEAKRGELLREYENDAVAHQLDREADVLRAQLDELKAGNSKKAVAEGAARAVDPERVAAKERSEAEKTAASDEPKGQQA